MLKKIFLLTAFVVTCAATHAQVTNAALDKQVVVSSENKEYRASMAVDGIKNEAKSWRTVAGKKGPHFIEIDLHFYHKISAVVIYGLPGETAALPNQLTLQYWDDANWTDLATTAALNNENTAVTFTLPQPVTTFMVRIQSNAAAGLAMEEVEVYGIAIEGTAPKASAVKKDTVSKAVSVNVSNKTIGKTLKYVGYNQGYYMPGSNVSAWLEYASVNSLRVWTGLNEFAPAKAFSSTQPVNNLDDFERQKKSVRADAENTPLINWPMLKEVYAGISEGNKMVFDYALHELKSLHIDVILQVNERNFSDNWQQKWLKWQQFYALAYYAAKAGDVRMFAMQNEPNHRAAGPMQLETWTRGLQIASDAVRCAVEDVNRRYNKNLQPKFVAPVTAGNNTDWWAYVVSHIRDGYDGKKLDHDLFDIFSTHSYNQPATGYATRVADITEVIRENHPLKATLPVVFTETGRWMNALLIDKEETYDSPSAFTEWAGIYANNMKNGAYGMWAFKFANTTSDAYTRGIKSGHHLTWQGKRIVEDAYHNVASGKPVTASANSKAAGYVTDGDKGDSSAWQANGTAAKWVEIDLGAKLSLGSAVVYTGSSYGVYTGTDRVKNFSLQYLDENNAWQEIPGAAEKDSKYVQLFMSFKKPVNTSRVRWISTDTGLVKLREIKLFAAGDGPPETAEGNYNISGILRTGEVVRLFAKGFKDERNLLQTTSSVTDNGLDTYTCYDAQSDNYYMWLVQRGQFTYNATINVSVLGLPAGAPATLETVDATHYGEVTAMPDIQAGIIRLALPPQSVQLLTIAGSKQLAHTTLTPAGDAMVEGGTKGGENFNHEKQMGVALDAAKPENNKVTYISFDLPAASVSNAKRIVLSVNGKASSGRPFRLHVYAIPAGRFSDAVNWNNAPLLDAREALIKEVGQKAFVAGELAFDATEKYHHLDVTDVVKKHPGKNLTFVFVRETRQLGDDEDKGRQVTISSMETDLKPKLDIWMAGN